MRKVFPLLLTLSVTPQLAFSQTTEEKKVARSNAISGAEAFEEGDYAKAIELLNRAESLMHAPTHLLMIAQAYVQLGKLADARETYLLLVNERLAENASDAFVEAQTQAQAELTKLEPSVPRTKISVSGANAAQLTITLDGKPFSHLALDVDTPLNPGSHLLEVSAPGKKTERHEWSVKEAEKATISLELKDDSSAMSSGEPDLSSSPSERGWQRPVGWTAIGVGVAGLGLGAVTAGLTASERSRLQDSGCNGDTCVPGTDLSKFHTYRTLSTVGFVTGGILAAAGITLVLTAPTAAENVSLTPYLGLDSLGVKGSF